MTSMDRWIGDGICLQVEDKTHISGGSKGTGTVAHLTCMTSMNTAQS